MTLTQAIPGTPTMVAAKIGYRAVGIEFYELPAGPFEIVLRYVRLETVQEFLQQGAAAERWGYEEPLLMQ